MFEREFTAIKPISIDYAVMEHATDVAVIEAPFEWDDLGGWQSLARLAGTDVNGNTIVGRHLGLNTNGTIVRTDDEHLVVTLGLEGLHRRPHAERHAGGQQARRGANPAGRERARNARLDRIPVTRSRESIANRGIDYGTVRIGIALADTEVGIAGPYRELHPPHAGARRRVLRSGSPRKNRSAGSSSACRCISTAARARSRPRPARSASGSAR